MRHKWHDPTEDPLKQLFEAKTPVGWTCNAGSDYIPAPLTIKGVTRPALWYQVIESNDPIILMGTDQTDWVYATPFYTTPRLVLPRPPKYTEDELKTLEWGYRRQPVIDQCLRALTDKSIPAEVC